MEQLEKVELTPMTPALCRAFYRGFTADPALYMDLSRFAPFVYRAEWVEAHYLRQQQLGRINFAIMQNGAPVGELLLRDVDREAGVCTLGIHLQNDAVKGRGIGTRAEQLALAYAFTELGMRTVLADAVQRNARSRHVLGKLGFSRIGEDETFVYYRFDREDFQRCAWRQNPKSARTESEI